MKHPRRYICVGTLLASVDNIASLSLFNTLLSPHKDLRPSGFELHVLERSRLYFKLDGRS